MLILTLSTSYVYGDKVEGSLGYMAYQPLLVI